MQIGTEFLLHHPTSWNLREDYIYGQQVEGQLCVVNDHAERGVALIEEFNSIITKNEEQMQYLPQVARDRRQRIPLNFTKKNLK